MYVVTFYSFKGGVGRSMSLMNVAGQLAKTGKKVLVVDFDLEAPGLTTFRLTEPLGDCQGLVEYVTEYRSVGEAPKAIDFTYQAKEFPGGGSLWVMPAGRHDSDYSSRLNGIDWRKLYEEEEGYIFFEDLKQQWSTDLNPDYVFIDSRTGHSDVEGICTRQLPDAVCLLFFPNEQNLQGLRRVARNIVMQNESRKDIRDPITLHYAVSNLPDLDDEDGIIGETLEMFRKELGYSALSAQIHHYNSLTLLKQEIFSIDRPKSRLAKEYRELGDAIVRENLADRSAAIQFLRQAFRQLTDSDEDGESSDLLVKSEGVLFRFPGDVEIAYRVALIYEAIGRPADALSLLSTENSFENAAAFATRARLNFRLGNKSEATTDIALMLDAPGAEMPSFLEAVSYVAQLNPSLYDKLPSSTALLSLSDSDQLFVAMQLDGSRQQLQAQEKIMIRIQSQGLSDGKYILHFLMLASIGLGKFEEAVNYMSLAASGEPSIEDIFNGAMARWGLDGRPPEEQFKRVSEIDESNTKENLSPNYLACLAITYAVLGNRTAAKTCLERAKGKMMSSPRREFSPWTYTKVSAPQFMRDLGAIQSAIEREEPLIPAFISEREVP